MIYIDGHWEFVDTLQDVSRIIRENYSYELADKMDELIDGIENREEDNGRIEELEEIIEEIRRLVL